MKHYLSFITVGLVMGVAPARAAEVGISDDRVLFGQSAALTGPAADLGTGVRLGIQVAFREVNARGGVHGRRLELRTLDDSYEPEKAIVNTRELIEGSDDPVFALIGAVGTPTSRSAAPIAFAAAVPYLAPYTGASLLRQVDELPNVVNLRASYNQETEEIVDYLRTAFSLSRIAVLHQDDSYGRAGLQGVLDALQKRGMEPAGVASYVRNTTAVKTAVLDLRANSPEAVVLVGAYQPVAAAIAWARHIGFDPVFFTISFSGGNALARELGTSGDGVFVSQVVPFPMSPNPAAVAYRRALAAYSPKSVPGFVSFEGYLAGRLAIVGLQRTGRDLTRQRFLDSLLLAEPISLNGLALTYGENDNQGSDAVFLTVIRDDGSFGEISGLPPGGAR